MNTYPCWNTYDPLGLNRIVKFPELYEIRFSVFAPDSKSYTSKFYFLEHLGGSGNVLKTGLHTPNCEYAEATLSFAGFIFKTEYAALENGILICKITPLSVSEPFTKIIVEVTKGWNLEGDVSLDDNDTISFPTNLTQFSSIKEEGRVIIIAKQGFQSRYNPGSAVSYGVYSSEDELIKDLKERGKLNEKAGKGKIAALSFIARVPLRVIAAGDKTEIQNSLMWSEFNCKEFTRKSSTFALHTDNILLSSKRKYEDNSMKIIGGEFEGISEAILSVINWCVVWDQLNSKPYTPITRAWIDEYLVKMGADKSAKGPILGLWDNLFNALLHSIENKTLSENNVWEVLNDSVLIEGEYPPNYVVSNTIISGDRSQPPIGAFVVWKLYKKFGDVELLNWAYPRLKRWHQWWKKKRDGNRNGLFEWGSNANVKKPGNEAGTLIGAKCESGMDNSPQFDDTQYDEKTGTMNMDEIGLNSMLTADAKYLSLIAKELNFLSDSEEFRNEYNELVDRINKGLWNEDIQSYIDRYWDGKFSKHLAPTSFYPLMARVPSLQRAKDIVDKHLLNEEEFWGEYVIPSISKKDQAYNDQLYWRGRIWPSMNYLVYLGLKEYEFDEIAFEFAKKSVELFMKEWKSKSHCHENYNAITGEGDDVPISSSPYSQGSDRFYSWGALLVLMGLEEIIDVEMEEGLRFGNRFLKEKTVLKNYQHGNHTYQIETYKDETRAFKDRKNFFSARPGVNVRNYIVTDDSVKFRAAGNEETNFIINEFVPDQLIDIFIDEKFEKTTKTNSQGIIIFSAVLSSKYRNFVLKRRG